MSNKRTPIFLLAGGHGTREVKGPNPLFQSVFRQTGVHKPAVAYVGAASGDNAEFRLWLSRVMQRAGAGNVTLAPLCGRHGDAEKAKAVLEASDLVFVSGGDVHEGMRVLRERGVVNVLQRLYQEGKPFFGMSAGSIMLARQWIHWPDEDDDASVELFACLELAPVLCDAHGEDEGWEELQALLMRSPAGATGYGIVSGAAIVVKPDGAVSALGGEIHRFQRRLQGVVQIAHLSPEKDIP